jgi:hypothetical protein
VNLSVAKVFTITQGARLELRLDAFNALNHVNYSNPNTNITSPDFGRILSSAGARTAQLGARFSF